MRRRDFLRALTGLPALASSAAQAVDYPPVLRGRPLVFPRDRGAHPDYRTEWWYATGWLALPDGSPLGFQSTFFRVRSGIGEDNPSAFAPRQILLAHAALADPQFGRLRHDERSARAGLGRAGFEVGATKVWIGDWCFEATPAGYRAVVRSEDFSYALEFVRTVRELANGDAGFSAKAADPLHASYYYSEPQLEVGGSVTRGGRESRVGGRAWLDHEWSSELLPANARGWDWVGVNLADGGSLMAFRMRDAAGQSTWAGATSRDARGVALSYRPEQVAFEPLRQWRSPRTGISYPVEWRITVAEHSYLLKALFDDQELDSRRSTGSIYWEGAARVYENEREAGKAYLEMTGYGERLRIG
jgi:predicted secreted hydrolase